MCCKQKHDNGSSCCRRRRNQQGPMRSLIQTIIGTTTNRNAQRTLQDNTDSNVNNTKLYESTVSLAPHHYGTHEDEKWAQQHGYAVEKGGQQRGIVENEAVPPRYEFVGNEK